jgi:hypothetical protein
MDSDFVERREAGFYLTGSRVPIDRVVWEYRNGEDPGTNQSHYPTLSLEQVNGAIAFYLNHKDGVDQVVPSPPHFAPGDGKTLESLGQLELKEASNGNENSK